MFTKPILAVLVVAVGACGVFAFLWNSERGQRLTLEADVQALELARDQAREAEAVADAYRQREEQRAAELQATLETLLTEDFENADDPIDPAITRLLDCLRQAADPQHCSDDPG